MQEEIKEYYEYKAIESVINARLALPDDKIRKLEREVYEEMKKQNFTIPMIRCFVDTLYAKAGEDLIKASVADYKEYEFMFD